MSEPEQPTHAPASAPDPEAAVPAPFPITAQVPAMPTFAPPGDPAVALPPSGSRWARLSRSTVRVLGVGMGAAAVGTCWLSLSLLGSDEVKANANPSSSATADEGRAPEPFGTDGTLTLSMLAIGNPPADDPRSWFEGLCDEGDNPEEPTTITVLIATFDSPAITKERVPYCNDYTAGVPKHSLALHLPDMDRVDRTIREYGEDHPYAETKVYARFPKGGGKVIPVTWVEDTQKNDDRPGPAGSACATSGFPPPPAPRRTGHHNNREHTPWSWRDHGMG